MTIRDAVVETARGWIGTRFSHQGRLRKNTDHDGGCDCLGLLMGVAYELRLRTRDGVLLHTLDNRNYGRFPHFDDRLFKELNRIFVARDGLSNMQKGDIALFRPRHLGIVSCVGDEIKIIHACLNVGKVTERTSDAFFLPNYTRYLICCPALNVGIGLDRVILKTNRKYI